MSTLQPVALLLDDCRGVTIPRAFVTEFKLDMWEGIDQSDIEICKDLDHESYWDAWQAILDNATFTENGNTWHLMQDGCLFAYCPELMDNEEKENLGIED